jgi:hypothetical protein
MKKRSFLPSLRPGGILRWSTACLLAGSLGGCDRGVRHVMTEKDAEVAETQSQIDKLDTEKSKLTKGEVSHNFNIPRVGYYHADARNFYEHPYGFSRDGRYFINGEWKDEMIPAMADSSRPTPEALKKVEAALEEEQKTATNSSGQQHQGFGMGNALMMYWLLSGNRGMFSPGAGFQRASGQAGSWQRGVEDQRGAVGRYAAANPGYQRMVEQSRASGVPVKAGQSVRGGFGSSSSRTGGGSSFGS